MNVSQITCVLCIKYTFIALERRLKRQAHQCTSSNSKNRGENRQLHTLIERKTLCTHEHAHTEIPATWVPSQDQPIRSLSTAKRSKHIHLLPLVCVRLSMHTHTPAERETDRQTDWQRVSTRCQVLFSNLEFDSWTRIIAYFNFTSLLHYHVIIMFIHLIL